MTLISSCHSSSSSSLPQVSSFLPPEQLDLIYSHPQHPVYFSRGQYSTVYHTYLVLHCNSKIVCKTVINQVRPELILLLCNWQLGH